MAQRPNQIQPMEATKSGAGAKGVMGGAVAAAVLIATPFIAKWEGKSNDPYRDLAGIMTVCFGETRVQMRRYTDAECNAMLAKAVEGFARPVAASTPTIANRPYQLAAASSFAYNVGNGAYQSSSARRLFLAGNFKAACQAFGAYNKTTVPASRVGQFIARGERCTPKANGSYLCTVKGLTNRRTAETRLCMTGLR